MPLSAPTQAFDVPHIRRTFKHVTMFIGCEEIWPVGHRYVDGSSVEGGARGLRGFKSQRKGRGRKAHVGSRGRLKGHEMSDVPQGRSPSYPKQILPKL